jgi:hypothetical protein
MPSEARWQHARVAPCAAIECCSQTNCANALAIVQYRASRYLHCHAPPVEHLFVAIQTSSPIMQNDMFANLLRIAEA